MENFLVIAVVGLILGLAAGYIYKEKKRGKVCVGCPYAESCGRNCSGSCSGCSAEKK